MSKKYWILIWYSLLHALIDFSCAGLIYSISLTPRFDNLDFFFLFIMYNIFAFGLQPLIGFMCDTLHIPRATSIFGCILVAIALAISNLAPIVSFFFAGLGNAFFHVGGGTVSLNIVPNKAASPGLFVAPGALGLFLGTVMGKSGIYVPSLFSIVLVVVAISTALLPIPCIRYTSKICKHDIPLFRIIVIFFLLSVSIRSLVGFSITFAWKTDIVLLTSLTIGVLLGKALGGLVADRIGWVQTGAGALLLSIPFLYFGSAHPLIGILGMFLFQMTMPVTLVALSIILPGNPGFAFGLTTLALLLGALPIFYGWGNQLSLPSLYSLVILVSATLLLAGLRLLLINTKYLLRS